MRNVVVCSTYKKAEVEWQKLQKTYPFWIYKIKKNPMQIILKDGTEYLFIVGDKSFGITYDNVYYDDLAFSNEELEEKWKSNT